MKKIILMAGAVLFCLGVQAQSGKPAPKTPARPAAATKAPAPKAPAGKTIAETTTSEPEEENKPAPVLDENGWPVADPKTEAATTETAKTPAKAGAKKPAAKAGAAAKKGAKDPAKPVVYLPAEFSYTLDAKPVAKTNQLPEKAKGLLSISVKNSNRVEKENPKGAVKVELTLVERARPNEPITKTITLGEAKKGVELQNFFGKAPKPGDEIKFALTNVKEPQVSSLVVETPESAIFTFQLDGQKIDRKKGIPANSTGVFVVQPKGADKLKKANAAEPIEVGITLVRDSKPVNVQTISLEEAQGGLLFEGLLEGAQPGDRVLIDLKNTEEAHLANFPLL